MSDSRDPILDRIPSADALRRKVAELRDRLAKYGVLLRTAEDIERTTIDGKGGDNEK